MLTPSYSKQFKKDVKRLERSGNKNLDKLRTIMSILISEEKPLPLRFRDHALSGNFKGRRDCHIEPDWVLIYKVDQRAASIVFERTGSHAELFE